jgi:hypothetical protein
MFTVQSLGLRCCNLFSSHADGWSTAASWLSADPLPPATLARPSIPGRKSEQWHAQITLPITVRTNALIPRPYKLKQPNFRLDGDS